MVNMRKCRKCKLNLVTESRKFCQTCKLQNKTCKCGKIFRSKKWDFCKKCRGSEGKLGYCEGCEKYKKLYWSTGLCQGCYKYTIKYKLNKETIKNLKNIIHCQICGIKIDHKNNNFNRAVIDHDHNTGRVRGVLCVRCNVIEGMVRDQNHLDAFYKNYQSWISQK